MVRHSRVHYFQLRLLCRNITLQLFTVCDRNLIIQQLLLPVSQIMHLIATVFVYIIGVGVSCVRGSRERFLISVGPSILQCHYVLFPNITFFVTTMYYSALI
jgi:hypothetical protein